MRIARIAATTIMALALASCSTPKIPFEKAVAVIGKTGTSNVTFFKIDPASEGRPGKDPNTRKLRDWTILQEKPLSRPERVSRVVDVLTDASTYSDMGAKCFTPGLAFRFEGNNARADLVVCLECRWIYVYHGDRRDHWALSVEGKRRLLALYRELTG